MIACSGMVPSLPVPKPALSAQVLTSCVLTCQREPVILARGWGVPAILMAAAMGSAARPVRFEGKLGEDGVGKLFHGPAGLLRLH